MCFKIIIESKCFRHCCINVVDNVWHKQIKLCSGETGWNFFYFSARCACHIKPKIFVSLSENNKFVWVWQNIMQFKVSEQ